MEAISNAVSTLIGRKPSGEKIRYAIVGAGNISQGAFMPGVLQTNNSIMTALVTNDDEKADKLAKMYNLKPYKYDQFDQFLLDNVCDALYIATPNWMHKQFAVPALEAGYHVLLEKPMEVTDEDCEAINNAQKKSGAKLMVAYRLHCELGTLTVIDRVRKGDIGDPRIFSSVFTQPLRIDNHRAKHGFNAGPVPDLGPYCINAARNLFGLEPIEVFAFGTNTPGREAITCDDTVTVTMRFEGDRVAQFTVGYAAASCQHYTIVGTKGEISVTPAFMFGPGVHIGYKAKIDGKEESKTFPEVDQFGGETDYFSDCILNNLPVEPNGEEGALDVRVIMAIKKSLETKQNQKLQPIHRTTARPVLSQKREVKQATPPKDFIGRDSQPPVQS